MLQGRMSGAVRRLDRFRQIESADMLRRSSWQATLRSCPAKRPKLKLGLLEFVQLHQAGFEKSV
jgi:hypothetical protein